MPPPEVKQKFKEFLKCASHHNISQIATQHLTEYLFMALGISLPLENFALKNVIPRGGLGVCRVSERIWASLWIYDDLIFLNYALLLLTVKYPC